MRVQLLVHVSRVVDTGCWCVDTGADGWNEGVGGSSGPALASAGRRGSVLNGVGLRWPTLAVVGLRWPALAVMGL